MFKVLLLVALRNLGLHRVKTAIVGGILGFGTFLVVVGLNLADSIESSMASSVIGSVAGHLQIYSDAAKDELALFGGSFMGREDVGVLDRFATIRDEAKKSANVDEVVPMGFDMGLVARGNEMDELFEALRAAVRSKDQVAIDRQVEAAKSAIAVVKGEVEEEAKIVADEAELARRRAAIETAQKPDFWAGLTTDAEKTMTFLESRIAPISGEKTPIYLRYLGTDIEQFRRVFSKFRLAKGEMVPSGRRGILLSNKIYEDFLKNIVARSFDLIKKGRDKSHKTIKDDVELKTAANDLPKQYLQVLVYLDREEGLQVAAAARRFLAAHQESPDGELPDLVKRLLTVDDQTFDDRRDFFYENIAPKIKMYEVVPGETLVLRAYTRSGYLKSVPVKVYGTYSFDGLEDSDVAGSFSILDLMTFRDLYGQMSAAALAELQEIKKSVAVKEIAEGQDVEAALFGGGAEVEAKAAPAAATASATPGNATARTGTASPKDLKLLVTKATDAPFTPDDVADGLILNAAVTLKDPKKIDATRAEIAKIFSDGGNKMRVVDWKSASGTVGQFVVLIRAVLFFAVAVILIVALAIINNSMIMATIERIREIGTMRAIGAPKAFVLRMFLIETLTIGVIATSLGALIAMALLLTLGKSGIPAGSDFVAFLFSGPRLYPKLEPVWLVVGPTVVCILATAFTMYPALMASRVAPANAMQEKE